MLTSIRKSFSSPVFPADEDKTRRAYLLNVILNAEVVILALTFIPTFLAVLQGENQLSELVVIAVSAGTILLWRFLMWRGQVSTASAGMIFLFTLSIFGILASGGTIRSVGVIYLPAIVIMAILLISRRAGLFAFISTALIGAALIQGEIFGILPSPQNTTSYVSNAHILAGLGMTTVLLYLAIRGTEEALTRARHSEQEIRLFAFTLEQRVAERTHDLELASEVGRTASQKVANLDELLSAATELIRDRFNLYYTQIYLIDPSERMLVLRAGTGNVGAELIRRGHRLMIGFDSINGRAVSDKQAVTVADTTQSASFLPNPLLPNTHSEMAVPLIAAGHVVGVLDMQSEQPGALSESNLPAFETLAGQLAIAIQNASLFAEAEQARSEMEAQAQRLTSSGWQDFLNGIERGEQLSYAFDQTKVISVESTSSIQTESALTIPISIVGAEVGRIQLEKQADHIWTEDESEVAQATANLLARHVENLRLLAQAEQYRFEAEQVSRRLTHAGWNTFLENRNQSDTAFIYDLDKVRPFSGNDNHQSEKALKQFIVVRDETIGELTVDDVNAADEKTTQIVAAVANQLSGHIENLRLLEQTQQRTLDLEEAQTFLDSVIESLPHMLFVKDAEELRFLRWNKAAEELVGFSQEAMLGKNDYDFFPKEEADFFTLKDREVLASGKTLDIPEEPLATAYRGTRFMHTRKAPVYGADGKPKYLLGVAEDITERKKSEEVIRMAHHRAQIILESVTIPMVITRLSDNYLTFVNPPAIEVTQFNYEEVINQPAPDFYANPEDRKKFINELRATGNVSDMVVQLRRKSEEAFWALLSARVFDYQNEASILTTFVDITERIHAEEAIKAEQQRAQTILETVSVPMIISRLSDSIVLYANQALSQFRHVPLEELIGAHTMDYFVNPDDRVRLVEILKEQGQTTDFETQLKRKDGTISSVLLSARIINYQNELCVLTTYVDITDRILAEESVAKRAAELQTVAKVSTTTATTLEPDRLLQAVVDLTKEQFGLYHAHIYLVNESWNTLLLAAGAGEVGRAMVADNWSIPLNHPSSIVASAAQNKKFIIANDVYRDKDSSFLSNRLLPNTRSEMAVPMIVGEKVLGVFDVQSDVADHFTEEDANIYTTLAAQVAIALQNARLYVEQAATVNQLRELDKLKSSFLANMSHELRTPLNSILGFADVMLEGIDGKLTDYMDNDLRLIQKNGQHLLHLINDVLDMAKIESGRMNLNPEKFKIHEIFDEVTSITSTLANEKNLPLLIDGDSDKEVEIFADRTRLRQVMINLVNNAIKFTEAGKITLHVIPEEGARVIISVKDTGIAIPPEKLEVVFQEFTQVDSSATRKVGGTGLGLPISRRLVELHGGRLWAESTGVEGEGSTFYVELPLEARIIEVVEKQEK